MFRSRGRGTCTDKITYKRIVLKVTNAIKKGQLDNIGGKLCVCERNAGGDRAACRGIAELRQWTNVRRVQSLVLEAVLTVMGEVPALAMVLGRTR